MKIVHLRQDKPSENSKSRLRFQKTDLDLSYTCSPHVAELRPRRLLQPCSIVHLITIGSSCNSPLAACWNRGLSFQVSLVRQNQSYLVSMQILGPISGIRPNQNFSRVNWLTSKGRSCTRPFLHHILDRNKNDSAATNLMKTKDVGQSQILITMSFP